MSAGLMAAPAPHAIALPIRALRISLIAGALVDLSGGIPLLVFPEATARWLGEAVRFSLDFWPLYAGIFLFVLPIFYCITALDPARLLPNLLGAIAGRTLGALFYGYWYFFRGGSGVFLVLALMNLAFALYYPWVLGRHRGLLLSHPFRSTAPSDA